MRGNLEDNLQRDNRQGPGWVFRSIQSVQADNFVLDPASPPVIFLSPAGAIDVLMPTSTAARKGLVFIFVNLSGNIVTLKTDGDAAFTSAITVPAQAANAGGQRVICTGSATQALGWAVW